MKTEFLERMQYIVREGGRIALQYIDDSSPSFKPDQSILTKADQAISELTHQVLADFLNHKEHILIDEEDENRSRYLKQSLLASTPYIWAVDPIDGTRAYANRMPHFGISVGVIKDLKPWLGMVYFPVLKELFYCDGEFSYFIQNAFLSNEKKSLIKPFDEEITSRSIFFFNDTFSQHFSWDYKDCHLMIPACAVVDLLWPTINRGCGTITKCYLWDFAGAWPIIHAAGLNLRSFESGKILDHLDIDLLTIERTPWKIKDYYILSSERNFSILKGKIKWQG